MSITLEIPDLSPELEKQLAALPEEERGRYAAALMEKGLAELEHSEDDPAALAASQGGPKLVSAETMTQLQDLPNQPREVSPHWAKVFENYERLTGKSISARRGSEG